MTRRSAMGHWRPRAFLWTLIAFAACSNSDTNSPVDIGPPTARVDTVAVSLVVTLPDGTQQLRWVGDERGPLATSPEQTEWPWIGFGVPFELHWVVGSEQAPIVGYRWKASQVESAPFVPAPVDSVLEWSLETQASFSNDTDPSMLGAPTCFDGPDCPSLRRWGSTFHEPYRFQLEAIDQGGRIRHFEFAFHVNYPPDTRIVRGELPSGQSGVAFPRYWYRPDSGGAWVATQFADGDTIPAGAYVEIAALGEDRLASTTVSDSFCCDLALGPPDAGIRRQWLALGSAMTDRGQLRELFPRWTPPAVTDTTGFFVGPMDYHVEVRSVDEHERRDPSPDSLDFVAGFPPRVTATEPGSGDRLLLGASGADSASTLAVDRVPGVRRYWDPFLDEYFDLPGDGLQAVVGTLYSLPLRLWAEGDPRQRGIAGPVAGHLFGGGALSFAYRYRSENDPLNLVREGSGDGDFRSFVDARSPGALTENGAIEIFVPDAFWSEPTLFDPAGACPIPEWCDQGRELLLRLGQIELEVVAKTTASTSTLNQYLPSLRPDTSIVPFSHRLDELGRRSRVFRSTFEARLVLGRSGGQPVLWPPRP